ncbi:hypothetical protein ACFLTD_05555, partial [Elusimicrobiota bacterium]
MKYKKISYVAVFGVLWGLSELVLGTWLHILGIPFKGSMLAAIGIAIILIGYKYIPSEKKLVLIEMGMICAAVKFFSAGMVPKPNIYLSIIAEASLVQIGISLAGYRLSGYMLAAAMAMMWPPFSRIIVGGLILGGDYLDLLGKYSMDVHFLLVIGI